MSYMGGGSDTAEAVLSGSIAASFSPNVTAGSLMVALVIWSDGGTNIECTGVGDSTGATWTLIGAASNKDTIYGQRQRFAYSLNATAGAHTITATFNIQTQYRRIILSEHSGVATTAALDGYIAAFGTNTTATDNVSSGSITTTGPALIIGGAFDAFNSTNTMTAGTGFTKRLEAGLTSLEDKTLASAGTVAATWTFGTAGRYLAGVVAFKTAGGATQHPVSGTIVASSAASGSVTSRLPASGTAVASSALTGSATSLLPASGTIAATSALVGAPVIHYPVTGTVAGTSGVSGAVAALLPTTGTVAATSGTSGAVTVVSGGALDVSGTIVCTSGSTGAVALRAATSGTITGTSSTTGDVTALLPASGSVAATSGATGNATALLPATGTITATSTLTGAVTIRPPVDAASPTPATRTHTITAEVRTLTVAAESRTTTIPAETRTVEVTA